LKIFWRSVLPLSSNPEEIFVLRAV